MYVRNFAKIKQYLHFFHTFTSNTEYFYVLRTKAENFSFSIHYTNKGKSKENIINGY